MSDVFETTVIVECAPARAWQALTGRTLPAPDGGECYVLPGFPSFPPLAMPGASCTPLEVVPGELLRVRKDHHPCQGTEIAIRLEQAETGTRITIVQSGFGAFLDFAGRNVVFGHGRQIVADLALYLERGVFAPGRLWGVSLGATTRDRGFGLEMMHVAPDAFAARVGLEPGDVLVSLRGARIYDVGMLTSVLVLTDAGSTGQAHWLRGSEVMTGEAAF